MGSQPENKILRTRRARDAIFVHPGDIEYRREVSVSPRNPAGNIDTQIPAGTILDKRTADGLFYPCKRDTEQSGTTNANVVNVSDVHQFVLGDWVELPESVSEGADRFRQITGLDEDNDQLTLGGAPFSLSPKDVVRVIPSRPVDSVQDPGTNTQPAVEVADASKFEVGDFVSIGPATAEVVFDLTGSGDGDYAINATVVDEDGEILASIDAEYKASAVSAGAIADALQSDLNDQLSNAGLGTASVNNTSEVHVMLSDPDHELVWAYQDPNSEIVVSTDRSVRREVIDVDTGVDRLTLDEALTFSNGEQIVGSPTGKWTIAEETMTVEGPWDEVPQNVLMATRDRGEVKRRLLKGLVAPAEEALTHIKFSNIYA
jgi:hypothetical protein